MEGWTQADTTPDTCLCDCVCLRQSDEPVAADVAFLQPAVHECGGRACAAKRVDGWDARGPGWRMSCMSCMRPETDSVDYSHRNLVDSCRASGPNDELADAGWIGAPTTPLAPE